MRQPTRSLQTHWRRKLWRSYHQGAVGQEKALNWQLLFLINDQSGGFYNPLLRVSAGIASNDSRMGCIPFSERCRSKGPLWGCGGEGVLLC